MKRSKILKSIFSITAIPGLAFLPTACSKLKQKQFSIKIIKEAKTKDFLIGDTFSCEGLTLTVNYGSSTKEITSGFVTDIKSGEELKSFGTKTVNVSYTENGITANTSYTILVHDIDSITVSKKPKISYVVGERFTTDNLTLNVSFKDTQKTKQITSGFTTSITKGTVFTKTEPLKKVDVSYKVGNSSTATTDYEIEIIPDYPIAMRAELKNKKEGYYTRMCAIRPSDFFTEIQYRAKSWQTTTGFTMKVDNQIYTDDNPYIFTTSDNVTFNFEQTTQGKTVSTTFTMAAVTNTISFEGDYRSQVGEKGGPELVDKQLICTIVTKDPTLKINRFIKVKKDDVVLTPNVDYTVSTGTSERTLTITEAGLKYPGHISIYPEVTAKTIAEIKVSLKDPSTPWTTLSAIKNTDFSILGRKEDSTEFTETVDPTTCSWTVDDKPFTSDYTFASTTPVVFKATYSAFISQTITVTPTNPTLSTTSDVIVPDGSPTIADNKITCKVKTTSKYDVLAGIHVVKKGTTELAKSEYTVSTDYKTITLVNGVRHPGNITIIGSSTEVPIVSMELDKTSLNSKNTKFFPNSKFNRENLRIKLRYADSSYDRIVSEGFTTDYDDKYLPEGTFYPTINYTGKGAPQGGMKLLASYPITVSNTRLSYKKENTNWTKYSQISKSDFVFQKVVNGTILDITNFTLKVGDTEITTEPYTFNSLDTVVFTATSNDEHALKAQCEITPADITCTVTGSGVSRGIVEVTKDLITCRVVANDQFTKVKDINKVTRDGQSLLAVTDYETTPESGFWAWTVKILPSGIAKPGPIEIFSGVTERAVIGIEADWTEAKLEYKKGEKFTTKGLGVILSYEGISDTKTVYEGFTTDFDEGTVLETEGVRYITVRYQYGTHIYESGYYIYVSAE